MLLVDSFLVRDGCMLNPGGHAARLRESEQSLSRMGDATSGDVPGNNAVGADALLAHAAQAIPRSGLFFPKLTLQRRAEPQLELRPISESMRETQARLITHTDVDQRRFPRFKGPDFAWQETVRSRAQRQGAHDALLPDPDHPGVFRESAYGSIVAWSGSTLVVSDSRERLPSTTEQALVYEVSVAATQETGNMAVRYAPITLELLRAANAVWLLSSLHTIREVTHIDGRALRTEADAQEWRRRLWQRAMPVTELANQTQFNSAEGKL